MTESAVKNCLREFASPGMMILLTSYNLAESEYRGSGPT